MLRYLGLPLREIAALLNTPAEGGADLLTVTLARQLAALRERRDGLDRVLRAIEHAQRRALNHAEPEWRLYQTVLKEIQVQEATNWTEKYYSPKGLEVLREQRAALTPEQKLEVGADWQALFAGVQIALDRHVAPDSAEGRSLVARWMRLSDEFSQGNRRSANAIDGCLMTSLIGRTTTMPPGSRQACRRPNTEPSSTRRFKPACGMADLGFAHRMDHLSLFG